MGGNRHTGPSFHDRPRGGKALANASGCASMHAWSLFPHAEQTEATVRRTEGRRIRAHRAQGAPDAGPAASEAEAQIRSMVQAAAESGHPRVITVAGPIDSDTVEKVAEQLAGLNQESDDMIAVQFTSPGGSLQDGWALHDLFATNASPVLTVGFGYVGSAATIAFQGGVMRLISPNARLMIHQVGFSAENVRFDVSEMRKQLVEMERLQRDIERLFARRTGNPIAKIRTWCDEEKEFAAREAVKAGFADRILHGRRLNPPKRRR
jgi:ATP-dependent Clp protease protease subunit